METYRTIGLMSGTSLDGIDIAACEFTLLDNKWSFRIHAAQTYPYTHEWKDRLSRLPAADAFTFALTDTEYGHLLGKITKSFLDSSGFKASLIASHGHTVFHRPEAGLTVQIGSGSAIAAETCLPVICDFRSADVALGGQGAPLVPAGDRLLFPDYDACLNLGGFSNISMEQGGERIAFDICPVNTVLNMLSAGLGLPFDRDGRIAASGKVMPGLLQELNEMEYYSHPYPKSLGREWLENDFLPVLMKHEGTLENQMRTMCEHVAFQVSRALPAAARCRVLVTGGGTWNVFLMERIKAVSPHEFIIPAGEWTDFKEALVFAFLGVLRWRGEINVLRSVTGSSKNHSGGAAWHPMPGNNPF